MKAIETNAVNTVVEETPAALTPAEIAAVKTEMQAARVLWESTLGPFDTFLQNVAAQMSNAPIVPWRTIQIGSTNYNHGGHNPSTLRLALIPIGKGILAVTTTTSHSAQSMNGSNFSQTTESSSATFVPYGENDLPNDALFLIIDRLARAFELKREDWPSLTQQPIRLQPFMLLRLMKKNKNVKTKSRHTKNLRFSSKTPRQTTSSCR